MSKKVKRLFEGFQPQNYQLTINPDRDSMQIDGTVVITGQKTGRPSQRLTFHQHGLKITSATIIKKDKKGDQICEVARIAHHTTLDEIRLHTDCMLYPGSYVITLMYEGKVSEAMHGTYLCRYEHEGQKKALVATQFESHHARESFPCIDEPEAKATFDLTLLAPIGETALSNTPIATQEEQDGKMATTFETSPKMATYLLAYVYGDLQSVETTTKDGVEVRLWATKNHPQEALTFGLDAAKRGIEFFNDYYDVPYPLAKSDHVALPDFSSGAMENWGLITYRETCLLADPATTSQSGREVVALVVCHELSHMWFGDLVTMKWWDDLWLNESFANVMEYVAVDSLFPEWNIWNSFITSEGLASIRRDSIAGVQAIKTSVHHPDEISTLFDPSIVYAKGGRLIKMLIQYLGEGDFRKGLKMYFTKHAYGNTVGDDLWQALSEASGKDVAAFMNPWLERSGFPVVRVEQDKTLVRLAQSHFLLDPAKADADRLWPVPLLSTASEVPALLDTAETTVTLQSSDYIRINQGSLGHYIVQYANPAHAAMLADLVASKELDIAERLMLLSDSSMISRARMQSFATTLQLLEHYDQEDSESVWDIMSLIVGDARRFIDIEPTVEPAIKAMLRQLVEPQYQRLGWEEKSGESSDDIKLRATIIGLGVFAEHKAMVAHAHELFEAYKTDTQAIPAELRGIVFGAAIRNELDGAFEYLLDIEENTSNVDVKQEILGALTITHDGAKADVLLGRLKDVDKVRQQDVDRWLVYMMRNRHLRDKSWKWLRDNWGWIEDTFKEDKSYDYFPRYAASAFSTQKLLDEYKAFFEPMKDQPSLTRNIVMGIEELENRIAWLENDATAVREYFQKFAA